MARKPCVSMLVAFLFVILSVTGLAMFFHVRIPSFRELHNVAGIAFIVVGALHLAHNFRAFMCACRTRRALLCLGAAAALCAFLVVGAIRGHVDRGGQGAPGAGGERYRGGAAQTDGM